MRRLHATLMTSAMTMLALFCFSAMGQAEGAGADSTHGLGGGDYEAALMIGSLLPNQISGVTEIMGVGGVRGGVRIAPAGWWELGLSMGNGSGQSWRNATTDLRMDIPIENLVAIAFLGLDVVQYEGPNSGSTIDFGGHVGGGIQANIGGDIWLRTDMKFQFNPGTSLMIGLSVMWRFGGGGAGGG